MTRAAATPAQSEGAWQRRQYVQSPCQPPLDSQHSGFFRRGHQKCQQFIIPWWICVKLCIHRATASLSGLLGATLYHLFNCTPFWASTPMRSLHRFITACSISIVSFSKPMPLSTLLQTVSSVWKLYIVGISGIKVLYLDVGISEYKHCKNQIKN